LNWNLRAEGQHRILWEFYQELLRLRRDVPSLANLDKDALEVRSFPDEKVLLVRRWDASSQTLIVCSFNQDPIDIKVQIPAGNWHTVLDSNDERWGGKGERGDAVFRSTGQAQLRLAPWTFLVIGQD
jgi:maltooligosyltrehalose trehalohydrolase